jgi:DNA-binding transcriptional ArsR family regulator
MNSTTGVKVGESRAVRLAQADELAAHAGQAATLLKTLASAHRLQILCVLCNGEITVGEINARVRLSQSALSQHLAVLRAQGLVETRRAAQAIFYRIVPGPALEVMRVVQRAFCPPSPAPRRGRKPAI